ncbi:uncharacterized protein LOC128223231 [Mya arenaria]|uniref:uncharacterized protein LOC128223231 n=1 Tax=Mya arenaria TaxID=6604 RepID=UPI0022DEAEC8|nr:uncharacterized protein LOC128223231 [Mya arenaria]
MAQPGCSSVRKCSLAGGLEVRMRQTLEYVHWSMTGEWLRRKMFIGVDTLLMCVKGVEVYYIVCEGVEAYYIVCERVEAYYIVYGFLFLRVAIINSTLAVFLFTVYFLSIVDMPKEIFIPPKMIPRDNTKYVASLCNETFNATFEDNLKVIQNYPHGKADDFMWKIGKNKSSPSEIRDLPVFVTAFDRAYYPQSQGLFYTLHRKFLSNPKYASQFKLIVYDMGMSIRQLKVLKAKCRCELRRFPFEDFPEHVRQLRTYAFKPIIVQQVLLEYGFVWWVDSSVRFTESSADPAIRHARETGMFYTVSSSPREEIPLTLQTDVRTFEFLGEDRCKFRPFGETWATTVMFYFNEASKHVVKAWTICALNKDCMAPNGTEKKIICDMNVKQDGRCHRFDQSVLGILTRRLYHEQNQYPFDGTINDVYEIKRGDMVSYFESCRIAIRCM